MTPRFCLPRFLPLPMKGLEATIVGELERCQEEFGLENVAIPGDGLSSSEISMTPRSATASRSSSREVGTNLDEVPGV